MKNILETIGLLCYLISGIFSWGWYYEFLDQYLWKVVAAIISFFTLPFFWVAGIIEWMNNGFPEDLKIALISFLAGIVCMLLSIFITNNKKMKSPKTKFFTINQLDIANFFGGPLIGLWILSKNYQSASHEDLSKKYLLSAIICGVIWIFLFGLIDLYEGGGIKILRLVLVVLSIFVIREIYKKNQKKLIPEIRDENRVSGWKVFFFIIITVLINALLLTFFQDLFLKFYN